MNVREATEKERKALGLPSGSSGFERWNAVLDVEGEVKGHICLSWALGQCFGSNTKHWGEDSRGAAMLWIAARRKAKELGFTAVSVHVDFGDPMKEFWTRCGFEEKFIVMRGDI